jgi:hypothetical protein
MFDITSLCVGAVLGALFITLVLFVLVLLDCRDRPRQKPGKQPLKEG